MAAKRKHRLETRIRRLRQSVPRPRNVTVKELKPKEPKPPRRLIKAAMVAMPIAFRIIQASGENTLASLRCVLTKMGHCFDASNWALYHHAKQERLVVKVELRHYCRSVWDSATQEEVDGLYDEGDQKVFTVKPTQILWDWWQGKPQPGHKLSPFDQECQKALRYYGKAAPDLSTARKFYIICCYWSQVKHLSPAKIRNRYRNLFPGGEYCFPADTAKGNRSARERIKTGIRRGKTLVAESASLR